jgi:peptide-methionine (S)-S-oxide reductase
MLQQAGASLGASVGDIGPLGQDAPTCLIGYTKFRQNPSLAKRGGYNQGMETQLSKASFGAGCFWGVEAAFRRLAGVKSTQVGYMGGTTKNPTYEDVCTDRTGHAEVVEVTFDPQVISYHDLLEVFWDNHNPTTLNRQGPDVGAQYRSAIFYYTPEQLVEARASREAAQAKFPKPIVTQIVPASEFWRAEEYHQQYLEKRGQTHCHI